MESKEVEFQREKFSVSHKVASQVIQDTKELMGYEADDYIRGLFTMRIVGYFHAHLAEERELVYYADRPSFLDWLLRRKKKVVFNLKVKDIRLNPPEYNGLPTVRIYIPELK